jgi:hypothetical protein
MASLGCLRQSPGTHEPFGPRISRPRVMKEKEEGEEKEKGNEKKMPQRMPPLDP